MARRGPPRAWAWPATTTCAGRPRAPQAKTAPGIWPDRTASPSRSATAPGPLGPPVPVTLRARRRAAPPPSRAGPAAAPRRWRAGRPPRAPGIANTPPTPATGSSPSRRRSAAASPARAVAAAARIEPATGSSSGWPAHRPTTGANPGQHGPVPGGALRPQHELVQRGAGRLGERVTQPGGRARSFGRRQCRPQRRPPDPVTAALVADQVAVAAGAQQGAGRAADRHRTRAGDHGDSRAAQERPQPGGRRVGSDPGADPAGLADGGGERGRGAGLAGQAGDADTHRGRAGGAGQRRHQLQRPGASQPGLLRAARHAAAAVRARLPGVMRSPAGRRSPARRAAARRAARAGRRPRPGAAGRPPRCWPPWAAIRWRPAPCGPRARTRR